MDKAEDPNLVSLKEFILEKFVALEKQTLLVQISLEKRLDGMNEFRDALKDQQRLFVPRTEHDKVLEDIRSLRESRSMLEGKASQLSVNIAIVLAVAGLLIGVLGLILRLRGGRSINKLYRGIGNASYA
jgi:hypothetical protein